MKILVFTDTHSSKSAMKKIKEKAQREKPDLLLCCGDFTIFMRDVEQFFEEINSLQIKTYLIHGNHEDEEIIEHLCKNYKNIEFLHGKAVLHKNVLIMGYGGGGFCRTDAAFARVFRKVEEIVKKSSAKKILLLHQPPHRSGIDLVYGEHAGNKTTKDFIEKYRIDYVFAGHLHENSGKEFTLTFTRYINPGPQGKIFEI